ncbi:DUF3267 domain-containing protein [Pontibacillus salipaludis]|uniref:DUF3267 domain-containing protein n=1 Tax=Pontibacillus salipaludis TaxID=1697394 RepID=UPI0031EC17EE
MRYAKKVPEWCPDIHESLIEKGWIPLKEPKSLKKAILYSIPFMIVGGGGAVLSLSISWEVTIEQFGIDSETGAISFTINLLTIFGFLFMLLLHELLHLIFIPRFITSTSTYIGLTFYGGFVTTEEEISKGRYILVTLAPYLLLSIIGPVVLGIVGWMPAIVAGFIFLNGVASSVDLFNFLLISTQVPNGARLKSNGPFTYWKQKAEA